MAAIIIIAGNQEGKYRNMCRMNMIVSLFHQFQIQLRKIEFPYVCVFLYMVKLDQIYPVNGRYSNE